MLAAIDWAAGVASATIDGLGIVHFLTDLGRFTVVFALVIYILDCDDRTRDRVSRAWETLDSTRGTDSRNDARIFALETLVEYGADLSELDLDRDYLRRAKLSGAKLSRCYGWYVDLSDAVLAEADLTRANLTGVNLERADLRRADLSGAYMEGGRFGGANLRGARAANARIVGSLFFSADLSGADFSEADLRGAHLHGAITDRDTKLPDEARRVWTMVNRGRLNEDLRGAVFYEADLNGGDLSGYDFSGAIFHGVQLTGADLRGSKFVGALVNPHGLNGARVEGVDFSQTAREFPWEWLVASCFDENTKPHPPDGNLVPAECTEKGEP